MRQIKFRAWAKEKNKMIYPDGKKWGFPLGSSFFGTGTNTILIISPDGDLVKHSRGDNDILPDCEIVNEDFELMQFTGLLDKNGKEIYEGDIVEYENGFGEKKDVDGKPMKFEVRWDKDNACFFANEIFLSNYMIEENDNRLEIIGNIYENPELLK